MWYQALWRQKATYYFYEVYNEFMTVFKRLLFGENTTRLSLEATTFLSKRGTLEKMENYNVIRIFGSRESPFFLPWYISEKMFIIEVARQYRLWLHFFHEKRKRKFIPLPWKVGEIMLRGIAKIDDYSTYLNKFNTHDVPVHCVDDIQTMVSSTSQYKQRGKGSNEGDTQPPIDSQKGGLPKHSLQTTTLQ
jgi:hypothetical protein